MTKISKQTSSPQAEAEAEAEVGAEGVVVDPSRVDPLSLRNNLLTGLRPQNAHLGAVRADLCLNASCRPCAYEWPSEAESEGRPMR